MKRPMNPICLLENGGICLQINPCLDLKDSAYSHTDLQGQQEKPLLFSLCEVCNIQLNSAAQAQVHCSGRSHLKRVKQLNNGALPGVCEPGPAFSSSSAGSSCHSFPLPAAVRDQSLIMQSTLDMKPVIPFPVDATSPVGLFPNFNTMDPVQKAVINHTFGVSVPPKKKQVISCNICQLRFNSDSQAEAHYRGSKHAKRLKSQETSKNKQKSSAAKDSPKIIGTSSVFTASTSDQTDQTVGSSNTPKASAPANIFVPALGLALNVTPGHCKAPVGPSLASLPAEGAKNGLKPVTAPAVESTEESEEEKAKKLLYCSLCKVAVNSLSQLEAHNTGSKHKTMLEARNGAGPIKAYPRPGSKLKVQATTAKGSGLQNKTFHCEICDVHVNSEIQLKQHISSRRHKDRVAGKPMKPKYSPYNKQQRSSTALVAKLAFQKDLVKPLSPPFIPTPFSASTLPSITLHPRPGASLFQTSTLAPSFLRTAPGPIRPAAGSILYAPY